VLFYVFFIQRFEGVNLFGPDAGALTSRYCPPNSRYGDEISRPGGFVIYALCCSHFMEVSMECAIWNSAANLLPTTGDYHIFESARAGGAYRISNSIFNEVGNLKLQRKKLVTSWLCEQRRLGVPIPELTSYNLPQLLQRRPLSFSQRVRNALMALSKKTKYIGHYVDAPKRRRVIHGTSICRNRIK
jgi:hypothetical protein